MATTRRIRSDGLQDKTRELDGGASGKAEVEWVREMVASRTNQHLASAGIDAQIDHRSLDDQLLSALDKGDLEKAVELATREPTVPMGQRATALHRRGADCELANTNAAIRQRNARRYAALRQQLVDAGHLPPEGHSHIQALRDRERETRQVQILGNGSGAVGVIHGLGPTDDRRTPAERRDAKQEKARASLAEAACLWAEDFVATIDLAFKATRKLLKHHAQRAATFAHLPTFRADVRAFVRCLKRLKRDALRFRQRMEAEERSAHLVSQAQAELSRFDHDHPRPGLWTKREWQIRRARRLQAVAQRTQAYAAARAATEPEAQTEYTRRALETGVELERLSERMLARYPVAADLEALPPSAAPSGHPATDSPALRGPRM